MENFQDHRIARIILKMKYGIANEEEKRIFEEWMQSGENHQMLYDRVASDESLKEFRKLKSDFNDSTDYDQLHAKIAGSLGERTKRRKIKRRLSWWGSVAAVLVVGFFFMYTYTSEPTRPLAPVYAEGVASDTAIHDKVILVLGDGEKIGLKGIREDSLRLKMAVVVGQENKLVYTASPETGEVEIQDEPEINKVITYTGGEYCMVLSDGTRVWLNAESQLEYPVCFSGPERVVKLSGEAYFEVVADAAHPFIVETKDVRTRVLGTSFNIKAYENEPSISTTLLTGKVEVTPLARGDQQTILLPGMQSDWDICSKELKVSKVVAENAMAWKEGAFKFNKENIEVVTRQIERWYGVRFVYAGEGSKRHTYNGYFSKDESLESILEALTFTGGPRFKMERNVIRVMDQ